MGVGPKASAWVKIMCNHKITLGLLTIPLKFRIDGSHKVGYLQDTDLMCRVQIVGIHKVKWA